MPDLISKEVYDETIEIIEGKKQPSILLKEMQQWYQEQGLILYNLYIEKDTNENSNTYGKYKINVLTNIDEVELTREEKDNIRRESLKKFLEVCSKHHLFLNYEWANLYYPCPVLSGYSFPRIWRNEVIGEIGISICQEIERRYSEYGVEQVINSGFGGYTVFFRGDTFEEQHKNQIQSLVIEYITSYDKHHVVTKKEEIVKFDKLSTLEERYQGNLYYYYK